MEKFNQIFIYFICLVSAMGGLLFGYDWVVIGGAKPFYEAFFDISGNEGMQALAMSIALLGCLLGATMAGFLADKYGRKKLLIFSAFVFFVSSWGTGASNNIPTFILARLVGGIAIGLAADLSPMYIAEVAPTHIRGKLVTLNQLTIVIGILGAQIVNMLIAEPVAAEATAADILNSWNGQSGWRWMFWAVCIPSGIFFLLSMFIPESPRWLVGAGQNEQAQKVLTSIGGTEYAKSELESYAKANTSAQSEKGALSLLFSSKMRNVLVIGIVIAMFQQWSGTNVIFNYAQEIFQAAGYGISDVLMNIVVTGIANLIFTFVAIYTVERLGRKTLMLIGSLGLAGIYTLLGLSYFFEFKGFIMIVFVVLAIGFYAMSLGPITWVLLSEIFPNKVRGVAMAVCTAALWIASFLLTYTFPFLNSGLGTGGTFMLYAAICFFGFIFVLRRIPETKGKSLENIEKELIK
ncbi:sugar porter family MFS transporter [Bacteroides sp. OF04-15BH]|uniref:sugar porter family MFS transporter n=1 Tax=Bacteroides sp. OF04-15BH TaxID=2292281 RepID=UPI000E522839|nr:sugar porter family MFS transporter [Bacteroides sp. OF04-15BH]RHP65937.1 MFS transporter [Bacteroides sp. OF04-15BH]